MAEPSTGALAVTGVVASRLGAAFPQIDLSALVGAFGGAFLFVVAADAMPTWRRIGYLPVVPRTTTPPVSRRRRGRRRRRKR